VRTLDVPLDELRARLRDWIDENAPAGLTELIDWRLRADLPGSVSSLQSESELANAYTHPLFQEWERRCAQARLICPAWPIEYGGRGWDAPQMTILDEEFYRARLPRVDRVQGESMVGPSIILHGTDEQKAFYLPRIISGEHRYCQGFSEPGSGSDLASVRTRAVVEDDRLLITGQKVWTSRFITANMIFVLCRTDPAAEKHRGLSYAITEFTPGHNGIEVRPIRQMTGAEEFAEIFFDATVAPLSGVIGGLGNGWQVVQSTWSDNTGGIATRPYAGSWRGRRPRSRSCAVVGSEPWRRSRPGSNQGRRCRRGSWPGVNTTCGWGRSP